MERGQYYMTKHAADLGCCLTGDASPLREVVLKPQKAVLILTALN
jgi:hypothetical protein